ncbi:MAG: AmmeMemoRadiSam system radical SAM enzyme [Treponema sp.]|jgi:pyruvate formate lyase activating enzyme|nr:AmmeMemoRadiSam system radical SAM enzyme [Treponema sp.]
MDTSEFSPVLRPPMFLSEDGEDVICELCPNKCKIKSGGFGMCGVRGNKGGKGIIPFYGFISALANDPIEKKPLYHFKPGSRILSLGFAGCNLRCPFCQNWHISQNTDIQGKWMQAGEIISSALKQDSPSIAYTYSEPLVHIEYVLDCMNLAHNHGLANVLVTNGCITTQAAEVVLKLTDAANVDLKCFSAETYRKTLGYGSAGDNFQTVLDFIKLCYKMGVHIEITTLVVPDLNDSKEELYAIADFIAGIDREIPWHLTAYHPDYHWNAPPTDAGFLKQIAGEAKKKLAYVHIGNV